MKITSKKGYVILGTLKAFEDKKVTLVGVDGNEYTLPMTEKAAENFAKCEVKPDTFFSVFVVDETVESFKFSGRYRLAVEYPSRENPEETVTGEANIFIGRAARVTELPKSVQVSVPVQKKGETEWFNLNFWKGADEGQIDFGAKALLELQAQEGEPKPYFWAVTGGPRKYKDKNDVERRSYSVRSFAKFAIVK